jgi:hypothetical protein
LSLTLPSGRVSAKAQQFTGGFMKSIFLEGLKSAREIMQNKGIEHLDSLINELESSTIETTSLAPEMEKR